MKKTLAIVTILLCYFLSTIAQESTKKQIRNFKVWISLNNKSSILKGFLHETKDSSIIVSYTYLKANYSEGKLKISEIHYNDIDLIKIRTKNSVLKRTAIGAVTGLAIGVLGGLVSGDDDPTTHISHGFLDGPKTAGYKAISGGIGCAFYGAGIGALVGIFKLRIPINGDFDKFNRNKIKLKTRSFR